MVNESVTTDKNWLFEWWRVHKSEFPRMAAAARDYLAIPAYSQTERCQGGCM
jgi:hypothetical protein